VTAARRADEHKALLHDIGEEHRLGTHDFLACLHSRVTEEILDQPEHV